MGTGSSIPYHLRLNKAVEREIFISMLGALSPCLDIPKYKYIGMGGPFLEDFRVLHARVGIEQMVCVEMDENTHLRQKFNAPFGGIHFENTTIEEYLAETALDKEPVLVWLDYTMPGTVREQFETFLDLLDEVPARSIVRLTLNANANSLDESSGATGSEQRRQRFRVLQGRLGELLASDAVADEVTYRGYGPLLLRSLRYAAQNALEGTGVEFHGLSSFTYSDGQPMVTVTGVSLDASDSEKFFDETQIRRWPFYGPNWERPETVDLPVVSYIERLELHRAMNCMDDLALDYELPKGRILKKPKQMLEAFARYYRVMPSFAKVEF